MDATHTATDAVPLPPPVSTAIAPTPVHAEDLGGGRPAAPAPRSDLRSRVARAAKESVWTAVAGKASAVGLGMLGLAAIGAWSTLAGAGVPVSPTPRASADAHGAWVAPAHGTTGGTRVDTAGASPASAPSAGTATTATASNGPGQPTAPAASSAASPGVTADGRVVLNTATVDDLQKLPRVGPKRAQAIVDLRTRLGRFRKATDLLRVRGIGRKTLMIMLPKLVVDAPAETTK